MVHLGQEVMPLEQQQPLKPQPQKRRHSCWTTNLFHRRIGLGASCGNPRTAAGSNLSACTRRASSSRCTVRCGKRGRHAPSRRGRPCRRSAGRRPLNFSAAGKTRGKARRPAQPPEQLVTPYIALLNLTFKFQWSRSHLLLRGLKRCVQACNSCPQPGTFQATNLVLLCGDCWIGQYCAVVCLILHYSREQVDLHTGVSGIHRLCMSFGCCE